MLPIGLSDNPGKLKLAFIAFFVIKLFAYLVI